MSTPNLAIAHILQSQAQKEVTANEAFDALDQAIAGLLEVDVSAGGTVTADAAAALGCKILRLTGALAADAELVVPDNRKPYFVHNATGGGFAITVRTAAGLGVNGARVAQMSDTLPLVLNSAPLGIERHVERHRRSLQRPRRGVLDLACPAFRRLDRDHLDNMSGSWCVRPFWMVVTTMTCSMAGPARSSCAAAPATTGCSAITAMTG